MRLLAAPAPQDCNNESEMFSFNMFISLNKKRYIACTVYSTLSYKDHLITVRVGCPRMTDIVLFPGKNLRERQIKPAELIVQASIYTDTVQALISFKHNNIALPSENTVALRADRIRLLYDQIGYSSFTSKSNTVALRSDWIRLPYDQIGYCCFTIR
jgi:hypothetical protein